MVETAVADVVGPAVAADQPHALLDQVVGQRLQAARLATLRCRRASAAARRPASRCATMPASLVWSAFSKSPWRDCRRSATPAAATRRRAPAACASSASRKPEPELRVVLEERVRPGRSAAVAVRRVRRRRQIAAVDRRAAGGVGHEQPVAEQLREQLEIRRLAAARAGAGILEQRLQKLRALVIDLRQRRPIQLRQIEEEVVVRALRLAQRRLRMHVDRLVLRIGAILGRTDVDAQVAARAVLRRDLNREVPCLCARCP